MRNTGFTGRRWRLPFVLVLIAVLFAPALFQTSQAQDGNIVVIRDNQDGFQAALQHAEQLDRAYPNWLTSLPDCPINLADIQALADAGNVWEDVTNGWFQDINYYHPGAERVFRSIDGYGSNDDHGQQCTYYNERLITSGSAAGTPDVFAPFPVNLDFTDHIAVDVEPFEVLGWQIYNLYWTPSQGQGRGSGVNRTPIWLEPGTYDPQNLITTNNVDDFIYELPNALVGQDYVFQLTAQNDGTLGVNNDAYTFSIGTDSDAPYDQVDLPDGLTLNPDGTISGTPTNASLNTRYTFTVFAESPDGYTGSQTYSITVRAPRSPSRLVDVMLIIDSSGSMSWNDTNNQRLAAARAYVTASRNDDQVGVARFSSWAQLMHEMVAVDATSRLTLRDAINSIGAGGGTDIRDGINEACTQLTENGVAPRRGAILLTDGQGTIDNAQQCFANQGWPIYVFGFGNVNEDELQDIARDTGGEYRFFDDTRNLVCEFQRVRALIAGMEAPPCTPYTVAPDQLVSFTVDVAAGLSQTTFSATWDDTDAIIEMTLTSPSGRVIESTDNAVDVLYDNAPTFEVYTLIDEPEAGTWQVDIFGRNVPAQEEVVVFGYSALRLFTDFGITMNGPDIFTPGTSFDVGVGVENIGPDTASAYQFVVQPSANVTNITSTDATCTPSGQDYLCSVVGVLQASDVAALTLNVTTDTSNAPVTLNAEIAAPGIDSNDSNDTATLSVNAEQSDVTDIQSGVILLTNQLRQQMGVDCLLPNESLRLAAQAHSDDMQANNFFSHTGSDGSDPTERAQREGYAGVAGENIHAGTDTPELAVASWRESRGHFFNMTDERYQEIGVALTLGDNSNTFPTYWTMVLGIDNSVPRGRCPANAPAITHIPTDLSVEGDAADQGTSPTFQWIRATTTDDNRVPATEFTIEIRAEGADSSIKQTFDASQVCSGATCSAQLDDLLQVGMTYSWWIGATSDDGLYVWAGTSDGMNLTVTRDDNDLTQPPAAPSDLILTISRDRAGYILNWTDNANTETGFNIYRAQGGAFELYNTTRADLTSFTDFSIQSCDNTPFTYQVTAINASGESDPSNTVEQAPIDCPRGDAPVTSIEPLPKYQATTDFTVSWMGFDSQGGDITYDVQYQVDGGAWVDWVTTTLDTSAVFTGEVGRSYGFRSRGTDANGNIETYPLDADAETTIAESGISGTIYAPNGNPVSGGTVQVLSSGNDFTLTEVAINDDGTYFVAVTPNILHEVRAFSGDFALTYYGGTALGEDAPNVPVSPGEIVTGIDIFLQAGGAISGTVTNDRGESLENMLVELFVPNVYVGYGYLPTNYAVCTDIAGNYTIENVPLNQDVTLLAGPQMSSLTTCAEENDADYALEFWEEAQEQDAASVVALTAQQPEINAIDFTLTPLGSVTIIVQNDSGFPVSDVSVFWIGGTFDSYSGCTDANGTVTFNRLRYDTPGMLYVGGNISGCSGGTYPQIEQIGVAPSYDDPDVELVFTVNAGGRIGGIVYEPDGVTPVRYLSVELVDRVTGNRVTSGNTNIDGRYEVVVPAGEYEVRANRSGRSAQTDVNITAGQQRDDVDLVLADDGFITGTIFDQSLNPIPADVAVNVIDAITGQYIAYVDADSNGEYRAELPPGDYKLYATGGQYGLQFYGTNNATGENAQVFSLSPGVSYTNIDFTLGVGGRISGTVRDPAGNALRNVSVHLVYPDGIEAFIGACTTADGSYTLNSVPFGVDFRVYAGGDRWCEGEDDIYIDEWWQEGVSFEDATPLTITLAGQTIPGIDFTLTSSNEGVITGTIFDIDGVTPINSGVAVNVIDAQTGAYVAYVDADNNGVYRAVLPIGTYKIYANGSRYGMEFYGTNNASETNATVFNITGGVVYQDIDFSLGAGGRITGVVRDTLGNPLHAVSVHLVYPDGEEAYIGDCTAPNGVYTLYSVPTNVDFRVYAGGDRWCVGTDDVYIDEWWQESASFIDATPIRLLQGNQTVFNIDFTLIGGNEGVITGTIFDTNGNPIPSGVAANVIDAQTGAYVAYIDADSNGDFRAVLPAGEYKVYANGSRYGLSFYNTNSASEINATTFTIIGGERYENVDFELEAGGRIIGTVRDHFGNPLRAVSVHLVYPDGTQPFIGACTNSNGTYTLHSVPVNVDFRVYAGGDRWCVGEDDVYIDSWWQGRYGFDDATPLTITTADQTIDNINFTLLDPNQGLITGTIFDSDGNPISSGVAANIIDAQTGAYVAYIDADSTGDYQAILPPGTYKVYANGNGYGLSFYANGTANEANATVFTLNSGTSYTGIDFTLDDGGKITGVVRDTSGNPLDDISVHLVYADGTEAYIGACTADDGSYSLNSVPANVDFRVYAGGDRWCVGEDDLYIDEWWQGSRDRNGSTQLIITTAGQTIDNIDFALPLTLDGTITGRVLGVDGTTPIENVTISTLEDTNTACTAADGTYTLTVTEGTYTVIASAGQCDADVNYPTRYYDNVEDQAQATPVNVAAEQTTTGIDFAVVQVLPELTQLAPEGTADNVIFRWSNRDLANYEIYIANTTSTTVIYESVEPTCTALECTLDGAALATGSSLVNGTYSWYVRELPGGAWVGPMTFTLSVGRTGLPTLEQTTGTDNQRPLFNWTLTGDALNATYFRLTLDDTLAGRVLDTWVSRTNACNGGTCAFMSPQTLIDGRNYALYMQAYGPAGMSAGGDYGNGYVGPSEFSMDIAMPELVSPVGQVNVPDGNPIYTWDDIEGADYYYLYVADANQIQVINEVISDIGYCNGVTCQIDPTTLRDEYRLSAGSYTFYVRAWKDDQTTPWSNGMSFTINTELPGLVTLGETTALDTVTPIFNWTLTGDATRATGFWLYLADQADTLILYEQFSRVEACGSSEAINCALTSPVSLADGVAYTLYVQTVGNGGTSVGGPFNNGFAGPARFTVDVLPPPIPQNVVVDVGEGAPTFTWDDDSESLYYELLVMVNGGVVYQEWHLSADICANDSCELTPEVTFPALNNDVYVRSFGDGGLSVGGTYGNGYSDVVTFIPPATAPEIVTNLSVSGELDGRPLFLWTGVANATYYNLYIATTSGVPVHQEWYTADSVGCATPGTCSVEPMIDLVNGNYEFYVRSYGTGGLSIGGTSGNGYSDPVAFEVAAVAAGTAIPDAPLGSITDPAPTFTWSHVQDVTYYQVYVTDANNIALHQTWHYYDALGCMDDNVCELAIPDLPLLNGAYSWYIQTYSPAGLGAWSGEGTFSVDLDLPVAPEQVEPADDTIIHQTNRPTFSWTPVDNATYYRLEVSNGLGTPVFDQWFETATICTTVCTYRMTNPIAFGGYTWRVQAYSVAGVGAWSARRDFLALSVNLQPLMVQVEDGRITRSGDWTAQSSDRAMGMTYLQSTTSTSDTITMTFSGTSIDVIYIAGPEYGTFVVEIDGQPMGGVDANMDQIAFGQIARFETLGDGEHTLRIVPLGGAPVAIDALVVDGEVLSSGDATPTPPPTQNVAPTVNPTETPLPTEDVVPPMTPTQEIVPTETPLPTIVPTETPPEQPETTPES